MPRTSTRKYHKMPAHVRRLIEPEKARPFGLCEECGAPLTKSNRIDTPRCERCYRVRCPKCGGVIYTDQSARKNHRDQLEHADCQTRRFPPARQPTPEVKG